MHLEKCNEHRTLELFFLHSTMKHYIFSLKVSFSEGYQDSKKKVT